MLQSRQIIRSVSFAGTDAYAYRIQTLPGLFNGAGIILKNDGEYAIKLMCRESTGLSVKTLSHYFGVPESDLFIETIGPVTLKSRTIAAMPGISIGHYNVTAGTLGCYVEDNRGNVYILSNNHVLADSDKGRWKDAILHPGPEDGGTLRDTIASLSYVVPMNRKGCNYMDAAIAKVNDHVKINTSLNKFQIRDTSVPCLKKRVEKFGRTTGHTVGEITTLHLDVNVEFEGVQMEFHDQFEVKGSVSRGIRSKFCDDGDSGSVIIEKHSHKAVGLLFAGTKSGTTFASPIKDVLSAFSVNII